MESSFRLIRVRGIDIGANWSWLFVFGFIIWNFASDVFPSAVPGLSNGTYWIMGAASAVLFVTSLLLHELGHAFRAQREGMTIEGITLWLFGGVAKFKGMFATAGAEFRIAIAGPLVTVALVIAFGALAFGLQAVDAPEPVVAVLEWLAFINVTLLAFNLLPGLPLDGGRVLRSFLWHRHGNFTAATVSAARVARFFAYLMIGIGVVTAFSAASFSGIWMALIGFFLLQAAQAEVTYAMFRQTLRGLTVEDLMTANPEVVDPDRSIASFINDVAYTRGHSTYPVVEDGRLVGLISVRLAGSVPFDERSVTPVRDVMAPTDRVPTVARDAEVAHAVQALQAGPGRALVVEDGRVAGILSMSDVARAIQIEQLRTPGPRDARPPRRRAAWIVLGIVALALVATQYAPPFVILTPGDAFDVTKDITIRGTETSRMRGKYVLTSVAVQQPTALGLVVALAQGKPTAPRSALIPRDVDPEEYFQQQETIFKESQTIAAAAAAEAAGHKVELKGTGARVARVEPGTPAARVLRAGDVVTEIDGEPIRIADDLARTIRGRPTGTRFSLEIDRRGDERTVSVRSQAGIVEGAPGIGVQVDTRDFDVDFPFSIRFRERRIGGPSAGLTYALAVYDLLAKADVADGRVVATTGTIDLEGRVGPIGGIEEKMASAQQADADLFLVPEDEVELARGSELEVRGVATLEDAIDVLRRRARS